MTDTLARYSPFSTLFPTKAFDDFFHNWNQDSFNAGLPYNSYADENGNTILEVAVAGFSKDDISVAIKGNTLEVVVDKKNKIDNSKNSYFHRGIAMRTFMSSWTLSGQINKKNIKSSIKDGILKIVIPPIKDDSCVIDIEG